LSRVSNHYALEESQLNIRGLVKQAFFEAIRRRNEMRLASENLQLLADLSRRIKVQYDVGEAPLLELKRAEAEVSVATVQAQSAERRFTAAMADLHAAVGAPLGDVEPTAPLYANATIPPLQDLINEVLAKHPGIAVAETETKRADALVNVEKKLRIPQPNAWVNVIQQPDVAQYWWGITIPIPIFNKREGQIAEAESARRQAESFAEYRKLQLTTAVERAFGDYRVAQSQVDMFEGGIVVQAEAAVDAAQAAFQFGERGIIEVLDAQRVLRTARLEYMNAQYDRQQALIALEQLGALDLTRSNP
jgi:cobalt-zinc-cadmium efflux system outer membrane protein